MEGGIGKMSVEMQRPAAGEIENGKGLQIFVVAGADDGALSVIRQHEGERRAFDMARMHRDFIGLGHAEKHVAEPVVGDASR